MKQTSEGFQGMLDLIRTLRGEGGCPWDRKQTVETLTKYVRQEFQELSEALDAKAPEHIQEEMGDLIFLLVFLAEIARERGHFSIDDVFDQIKKKMIGRHPHVFGEVEASEIWEIKDNWKKIKAQEKLRASTKTLAEKIPRHLDPLQQAMWVVRNVEKMDMIDTDSLETLCSIEAGIGDLRTALEEGDHESVDIDLGKLFFSLVRLSRMTGVNPDTVLKKEVREVLKREETE
jgi:tetrapyrrole methylase family protein/MazG family protein